MAMASLINVGGNERSIVGKPRPRRPLPALPIADNPAMTAQSFAPELRQLALEALLAPDAQQKVLPTQCLQAQAATIFIAIEKNLDAPAGLPGCPARPGGNVVVRPTVPP